MEPLALVVAMNRARVIGVNGALPWHISEDLKHFKRITVGHAIVMGRKTHESIGRPLPDRRNIVVSRQPGLRFEGCQVAGSLDAALRLAREDDDEPRIVGGASLYAEALPRVTKMFLTQVDRDVEGDAFFPQFDRSQWEETERRDAEEEGVTFLTLVRRS